MTNSIVGIVLLMLRFELGCDISVDLGRVLLSIDFRNDFKQHWIVHIRDLYRTCS